MASEILRCFRGAAAWAGPEAEATHTGGVIDHPLARASALLGVCDQRVLEAVTLIARADFVPAQFAADANRDRPIPIAHGQVTTQPASSSAGAFDRTAVARALVSPP